RLGDRVFAKRLAVRLGGTGPRRGTLADDGAALDERGSEDAVAALARPAGSARDGLIDRLHVMAIDVGDDMPAVGPEAAGRVVAEPVADFAVDRDAVVVVEHDEPRQPQGAGQRTDLVGDAFHQAAVADEGIG